MPVKARKKSKSAIKKNGEKVAAKKAAVRKNAASSKPAKGKPAAKKKSAAAVKRKSPVAKKKSAVSAKSSPQNIAKKNSSAKSVSGRKVASGKKPTIAEKRALNKRSDVENELSLRSRKQDQYRSGDSEVVKGETNENLQSEETKTPPVTVEKARLLENVFHHREEVALRQENNKALLANSSRKNFKRTYRMRGGR